MQTKEEQRQKKNVYEKLRRDSKTPEQKSAKLARDNETRRLRIANESSEDNRVRLDRDNASKRLRISNLSLEDNRARLDRKNETKKIRWANLSPEQQRAKMDQKNASRRIHMAKTNGHRVELLKKKYDLTIPEYDAKLLAQGGGCAICGDKPDPNKRSFAVDHDHVTGAIRAILCHHCNTAIGQMKENPDLLIAAAEYLKTFGK